MRCDLRKNLWVIFTVLFIFSSCDKEVSVTPIPTKSPVVISPQPAAPQETIKTYTVKNSNFDRVVGWISDKRLLIVERNLEEYLVYSYDLYSEEKQLITTVNEPVIDVKIHPSKNYLAIIMSDNSLQATIKIVNVDGRTVDQLTIESAEIYLDWHTTNSDLLLITSFNKDWSFDIFTYSSQTQEMKRIPYIHPILKWRDEEHLMAINWALEDALAGGTISEISTVTSEVVESEDSGYIYFDMYKDILVTVKIDPIKEQFIYRLSNVNTGDVKSYRTPALSNYSQWFVPELYWTEENSFLTYVATDSGLIDSVDENLHLEEFNLASRRGRNTELTYRMLMCSPSGDCCLNGSLFEEIADIDTGVMMKWLNIVE